jgi:FtsP/CotA-like multicopper oxidase with cupredoxin domain
MKPTNKFLKFTLRLALVAVMAFGAVAIRGESGVVTAQTPGMPPIGMVCTSNANSTFTLTTRTGYISVPDGNVVFMWGFSEGSNPFQHPSPTLCVNEGDLVTIVLNNTLNEDVSLVFPGQENVMANGVPSQPVFVDGNMVSLAPVASASGGSMTYSFVAAKAGTYLYESGTEPIKQVDMGLFGALIVRPATSLPAFDPYGEPVAYAYDDPGSAYYPAHEYLLIISEMDPMLHVAVEQGYLYNMNNYTPRYWMYNGRSFPDTVADNGAGWLPNQPYGSLIFFYPFDDQPLTSGGEVNENYNPFPALVRHINAGMMDYTHHPHGSHGRVIAWDGNLLQNGGLDMSYEKFAVTLAPGQTMDALYDWKDVDKWHPIDNPVPVVIPQLLDLTVGTFYSGSPYLGNIEELPPGTQALNQCGEYYHIAHNHALHQITAWGVVLSGHITFARIDPPLPNECP